MRILQPSSGPNCLTQFKKNLEHIFSNFHNKSVRKHNKTFNEKSVKLKKKFNFKHHKIITEKKHITNLSILNLLRRDLIKLELINHN